MYRKIFVVLSVIVILAPQAMPQDIFFDFENKNQFDQWENLAGYWDIDAGYYYEMDDANGPLVTLTGDATLTDYTIGVKAMGLAADADWGIVFRATDLSNFYSWQFCNANLYLLKYVGGTRTTIYNVALAEKLNEWQDFKVVVKGNTFECYYNGELKTTATDNDLASGRVGLFGWVNSGSDIGENFGYIAFDNFYVTTKEAWTVTRTFPTEGYRANQLIQGIALKADIAEGQTVAKLTVTETVPSGLTVSNVKTSAGNATLANNVITWALTNVSADAELTYDLKAPDSKIYGDITFSGSVTDGSITTLLTSALPFIFEEWTALKSPIFFDFSDAAQDSSWEDLAGDWGVQDGQFYEFDDAGGPLVSVTGDPSVTDYTITVKAMGLVSNADWGIVFRAIDINNFYTWQFVNGALEFIIYNKGGRSTVNTETFAESLYEWQEFKVEAAHNTFNLYYNGELKQTVTDRTHSYGRIGLFGWVDSGAAVADNIGGVTFDDFSATAPVGVADWMMQ